MRVRALPGALAFVAFLGLIAPASQAELSPPVLIAQAPAPYLYWVGPVSLGMGPEEVEAALGPPDTRSEVSLNQTTGTYVESWGYPGQGLSLTFDSANAQGPFGVSSLTLEAPSTLRAAAGISVGMLETEAYNQFKTLVNEDINSTMLSDDNFGVIMSSTYVTLTVECQAGLVKKVYLGPGAE